MNAATDAGDDDDYPTAIDLCAGCGGFSFGAQMVGYNVRAAFELDPAARYTYHVHIAEHDDMALLSRDVTEGVPNDVINRVAPDGIDAIFAGPPCQPFSEAAGEHYTGDPTDTVAYSVAEWITTLQPKVAAIENVSGLKRNHESVLNAMIETLRDASYHLGVIEADAANYGVPQHRVRAFLLAVRDDLTPPEKWKPPATHTGDPHQTRLGVSDDLKPYRTAQDALDDLPQPLTPQRPHNDVIHGISFYDKHKVRPHSCGRWLSVDEEGRYYRADGFDNEQEILVPPNHIETAHREQTRENMAEYPQGYTGSSTTERRLHPDKPAPTMTVSEGTPPIHYVGRTPHSDAPVSKVRRLTVREAASIQTFPDHWCFAGSKIERFRQVCNAVPPRLASHIADHLRETIVANESSAHQSEDDPILAHT